jgi:hypothetical protein
LLESTRYATALLNLPSYLTSKSRPSTSSTKLLSSPRSQDVVLDLGVGSLELGLDAESPLVAWELVLPDLGLGSLLELP